MYGTNEVTKPFQQADPPGALLVTRVFPTIQGEGPDAGRPAVFVRLTKCNLRCHYCDTDFDDGLLMPLHDLFSQIHEHVLHSSIDLVVITGGEPMLQNFIPLVRLLNDHRIAVSVETAGTIWLDGIQEVFRRDRSYCGNLIVCSPKIPTVDARLVPYVGAWKYIIRAGQISEDGFPTGNTQVPARTVRIFRPPDRYDAPIYYQPCDEDDEARNFVNLQQAVHLCRKHGRRLSVQLHKLKGVDLE